MSDELVLPFQLWNITIANFIKRKNVYIGVGIIHYKP